MSSWHYKKKYFLNVVYVIWTFIGCVFLWVGLETVFLFGLFGVLVIADIFLNLFINVIEEKSLTLIECKEKDNYFNCTFFDSETMEIIEYRCSKKNVH